LIFSDILIPDKATYKCPSCENGGIVKSTSYFSNVTLVLVVVIFAKIG
jgi:hypothetical protein